MGTFSETLLDRLSLGTSLFFAASCAIIMQLSSEKSHFHFLLWKNIFASTVGAAAATAAGEEEEEEEEEEAAQPVSRTIFRAKEQEG